MADVMKTYPTSRGLEMKDTMPRVTVVKYPTCGTGADALPGGYAKADGYSMQAARKDGKAASSAESKYEVPEGFKQCTVEVQGGGDACHGAAGSGGAAGTPCSRSSRYRGQGWAVI